MNDSTFYRINTPKVVHQTIDGEVVVIHLDSGNYYSLTDTAAHIWAALEKGNSVHEIISQLKRNPADGAAHEQSIAKFLGELRAELLIVPSADLAPVAGGDASHPLPQNFIFAPPELRKFTDMSDLLLLDPVHEVDPAGWPQIKSDVSPNGHARD